MGLFDYRKDSKVEKHYELHYGLTDKNNPKNIKECKLPLKGVDDQDANDRGVAYCESNTRRIFRYVIRSKFCWVLLILSYLWYNYYPSNETNSKQIQQTETPSEKISL